MMPMLMLQKKEHQSARFTGNQILALLLISRKLEPLLYLVVAVANLATRRLERLKRLSEPRREPNKQLKKKVEVEQEVLSADVDGCVLWSILPVLTTRLSVSSTRSSPADIAVLNKC